MLSPREQELLQAPLLRSLALPQERGCTEAPRKHGDKVKALFQRDH